MTEHIELIEDTMERIGKGMMHGGGMYAYEGQDVRQGGKAIRELKQRIVELEKESEDLWIALQKERNQK
jgi:hypothetical protein